ncbi:hypothetical protein FACS1894137_18170 [Spirochaetia bacterium]|nr:hypothetical protein FACS1894137_18170 [Spirochaetia bacterium]
MTPEGRIKAACLRYLERRGLFAWNNPTGAVQVRPGEWLHFGKKGSSDILGILPGGRFLAIEVKAKGGSLTPEQAAFLERVRGLGGVAIIARSFRDIDTALKQGGYIDDGPLFAAGNETRVV